MKVRLKSIPRSAIIAGSLFVLLVVLGLLFWKPLSVLRLQARAGRNIEEYLKAAAEDYENYYTCQIPAFTDLPDDKSLEQAVVFLEKAEVLLPQNAQTYLLLGRTRCLQGNFYRANEAFNRFTQERPDNPLGAFEAAFAQFTQTLTSKALPESERIALEKESFAILSELGYSGDYFLEEANASFTRWPQPAYPAAWYWYRLSQVFQPIPEDMLFRVAMMDLVFIGKTDLPVVSEDEFLLTMDAPLTIPPSAFFRLDDGSSVNIKIINEKPAAMFYRAVDPSGVFFNTAEDGVYCLTINALDHPPEPTALEIMLDLEQFMTIELTAGDDSWKSFTKELQLGSGVHLISIRLSNDDQVNGMDRNGHVGEIILEQCHK